MKRAKATQLDSPSTPELLSPARLVEADLIAAEARLVRLLDSNESIIAEICHYLVDAGGKRLRPTFIMLVYRACGGGNQKVDFAIDAAIALELIHSATLLHDDIIDRGLLRRGKPSAFARYGFGPSLIAGDYLFCRAFELCSRFEERLIRTAAEACIHLTEGEVMESRYRHNVAATLNDYISVIDRKTASLFYAGGKVAADLAGAPPRTINAMAKLGTAMGLAFQMVDDMLDILGPEEKIGKPVGSDLRAGIPSLPVVLGFERSAELRKLFQNSTQIEGAVLERALELLRAPEIVADARRLVAEQIALARGIVDDLPASPYREGLATLIDDQTSREV
ncbi:MAG: polyprenyl synthetase family protein [Candidatus Binatus sp.]|uniref:polyprenyl synthetase family protein n=1 Tax=Candidatus Binatus sp. TaxID=2811406 RepID=UPI0027179A59|nr:polyprenyl synthetase family protein [Candidatus Binatus sp.]MDO8433926.1 polyprenyl synthetase family protein [Candidatus Binatus sp.]